MPSAAVAIARLAVAAAADERVVASNLTLGDWVTAGLILVGALAAGWIGRRVLGRAVGGGEDGTPVADVVGRIVTSIAAVAGLLYALSVLGIRLGPLVGALGIGGLAIAFAAQSILANFLASMILQVRRGFRRGDQIRTNDCEGTVEDINFRTVVLRTYSGERALVPCAEVLSKPILNHTALGRRRTSLEIGIDYGADPGRAREVLLGAVRGVEGVRDEPEPEVWVRGFGTSSVDLVLRFWHAPDMRTLWRVRSAVAVAAKGALDDAGIAMPLPEHVLLLADPGARADGDGERADHFMY